MAAIPHGAVRLPNAASAYLLDPTQGAWPRHIGSLAPGANILVQAGGTLCFREVRSIEPAELPASTSQIPRGALAENCPEVELVVDARQAIGLGFAGSALAVASDQFGCVGSNDLDGWSVIQVDGAERIIVNQMAIATGPLQEATRAASDQPDWPACDPLTLRAYAGVQPLALNAFDLVPSGAAFHFEVRPGTRIVRLVSHQVALAEDDRALGVAMLSLRLGNANIPLDSPICASGFHPVENLDGSHWRWTDGEAQLLLPALASASTLSIQIADWHLRR